MYDLQGVRRFFEAEDSHPDCLAGAQSLASSVRRLPAASDT